MGKITILVAEDHHLIRAALVSFLAQESDFEVIGEVGDGSKIIEKVEALRPNVLILDVHMPGHRVLKTTRSLKQTYPGLNILALSAYLQREYVVGLLQAGADGYILKDDPTESLIEGIRAVMRGRRWVSTRAMDMLVQSVDAFQQQQLTDDLTERELAVLRLVAVGMRNSQIAEEMFLTEQTVKNYLRRIFEKLMVESRVEAVVLGIRLGLINIDNDGSSPKLSDSNVR